MSMFYLFVCFIELAQYDLYFNHALLTFSLLFYGFSMTLFIIKNKLYLFRLLHQQNAYLLAFYDMITFSKHKY